ncbi:hypothetical protein [Wenjunlia tyrosinilytica]|nr:hypothetical protein [Wenjunlia tyrosinilytica]
METPPSVQERACTVSTASVEQPPLSATDVAHPGCRTARLAP